MVNTVSDWLLKGRILGFEEFEHYAMQAAFGESSPFRLLACSEAPISFAVVNPYYIMDDYSFEIEDEIADKVLLRADEMDNIAVLCVVRPDEKTLYVNLRSPIIINIKQGLFIQTILQNDSYGVSVPFAVKKAKE